MKEYTLLTILLIFTVIACSKEGVEIENLSYKDFKELKPEMKYATIVDKFGRPDKDMGSSIHIYVYKLADNTEIWIGYTDTILYARHMDSQQNLLHVII